VLESCYMLPSDKYFRMTLIPELFTTLSAKLSDVLASAVGMSVSPPTRGRRRSALTRCRASLHTGSPTSGTDSQLSLQPVHLSGRILPTTWLASSHPCWGSGISAQKSFGTTPRT